MKGRMKEKMKRREKKEKMNFFFEKEKFQNPQTRQMNEPKNVSKKSFSDELFLHFSFESTESDSIFNYLHDSNSFFPGREN